MIQPTPKKLVVAKTTPQSFRGTARGAVQEGASEFAQDAINARIKPKGFLESVRDKIGSGMGYIDSVMKAHPNTIPVSGAGRSLPSAPTYKKPVKKP